MDNGTLMLNGTDYSSGKGTLIVNGVVYSGGGSGGGGGNIPYHKYLIETTDVSGGNASLKIEQYEWNYATGSWELLDSVSHQYQKGTTNYFDAIKIEYGSGSWKVYTLVPTMEYPSAQMIGEWSYRDTRTVYCTRYFTQS